MGKSTINGPFSGSSPAPSDPGTVGPVGPEPPMARAQSQQLPQRPPAEPRAQTSDGARERSPSPHTEPLEDVRWPWEVLGIPKKPSFFGGKTSKNQHFWGGFDSSP